MSEEAVSCDHTVKENPRTRTLKLNCKRCEEKYSLEKCLPSILLSLEDEYDIDMIIISDYMEKQYLGSGVKILTHMRDIAGEIESFSSRDQDQKKCLNCELRPSSMYPNFKCKFISDPGIIYGELRRLASAASQKKDCPECMKALGEELEILGKRALSLRSRVLKEGFDIIR